MPFPLEVAPSMGDVHGYPSNTWFRQPTRVLNRNIIWIGSVVSAGLMTVTDRHDRQTDQQSDAA